MRLKPEKCTFGVINNNFLGSYLMERCIEASVDKYNEVIKMEVPTIKKGMMKLNKMIMALNKFISRSS